MTKQEEIREGQAELEHEQWVKWSQSVAKVETLSPDRLARWKKLWVPYANLTEEQKDQDREWADISLAKLHSQGGVIKVKDIGPINTYEDLTRSISEGGKYDVVVVEPLVKEVKE